MRPPILDPLYAPVSSLKGVGPKVAERLAKLVGRTGPDQQEAIVWQLMQHLPVQVIDRRLRTEVAYAPHGAIVTVEVTVDRHEPAPRNAKQPYRVYCYDETGELALVFFHANRDYLERQLPAGAQRIISGPFEWFNGRAQIVHPDYIVAPDKAGEMPAIEPVYPMTEGLSPKTLRKAVDSALERLPDLPEWLSDPIRDRYRMPPFGEAIRTQHHPDDPKCVEPAHPTRLRLAYDELLAAQLAIALVRARQKAKKGRVRRATGEITSKIVAALPFALTPSQTAAIADIKADLAKPEAMLRLLQGDVGSGKTMVALMTMAMAVETGDQAALMAPTDLLARQHAEGLEKLSARAGLRLALLTGKDREAAKAATRAAIATGEADIVVGTHALFQQSVAFNSLGVIVVDEQHRFGVHQRMALAALGDRTDMLVMTATPIPRTLVLSIYGDMDVSALREKPAGRQPIVTRTASLDRLDEVIDHVGQAIAGGGKVYWVTPLVEQSDKLDITAAEERFDVLKSRFGERVELVHGRMTPAQKDEAMLRFKEGDARILVATTVIEVGVDVPDATIMVIEHAERFGLAQLHQLRGRVGRGSRGSSCLLLYKAPLGETAKARLSALRDSDDGFFLAEEDLKLRGEGDILGTRQSGLPEFRFADLEAHGELLEIARDDARYVTATDETLASDRGAALRILLYLFGRDQAVRTLRAG